MHAQSIKELRHTALKRDTVIIGNGAISCLARRYYPRATVIAPDNKSFIPVQHLYKTEHTLNFVKRFKIPYTEQIVTYKKIGNSVKKYNELTHKNANSKPNENRNEKISTLKCNLLSHDDECDYELLRYSVDCVDIDLRTIHCSNDDERMTVSYNTLFITSPLLFAIIHHNTVYCEFEYFPLKFIECEYSKRKYLADFIYLLTSRYLNKKIFRISYANNKMNVETTDVDFNDISALKDLFVTKKINERVMAHAQFVSEKLPFLNNADTHFISRHARLDENWMLHDSIKYLETLHG